MGLRMLRGRRLGSLLRDGTWRRVRLGCLPTCRCVRYGRLPTCRRARSGRLPTWRRVRPGRPARLCSQHCGAVQGQVVRRRSASGHAALHEARPSADDLVSHGARSIVPDPGSQALAFIFIEVRRNL